MDLGIIKQSWPLKKNMRIYIYEIVLMKLKTNVFK